MLNSLITGFKHIKTTIGGIAAIAGGIGLLAPELLKLANGEAPDMVAVKTAWVAICGGVALVFAKDADKSNAPSPTAQATSTPKGFISPVLLGALVLGLGLALAFVLFTPRSARADSSPGGPLAVCINESCSFHVSPGFGFAGTFYTKNADGVQIARNVSVSGMVVLTTPLQFDAVLGPAWQTGTAQGWGGSAGITEKSSRANFTALASALNIGGRLTWAFGLGTLTRF
jgi:hypothetical protein